MLRFCPGLVLAIPAVVACAHSGSPPLRDAHWRGKIKDTLFVPDPLPPLDPVVHGKSGITDDIVIERVTYGTQFGLRIPAILYLPKRSQGRIPALVVVNGHGGDKYSWYAFYAGVLYAKAGAAVLSYDPIGEGERNAQRQSGTRAHDKIRGTPELGRRLMGLMITDLMQAVSFLESRPEVDPGRIAAMGYSLGSFVVALGGAVETRLRAAVEVGGGNLDGVDGYWDRSKPMCQGFPYRSLAFLVDRPAAIYALHARRGPTLIFNGTEDSVVGISAENQPTRFFDDLRRRTVRLAGASARVFDFGLEAGASHRPFFVTRPVAAWLEKELDFPAWTDDTVSTLPVVQIASWARANAVEIDPEYVSEPREGGTPALSVDVPGLSRSDLSVFAPEVWQQERNRMILEAWLAHVRGSSPLQ